MVMVAGCPSLTLVMSDSLNETFMLIVPVLTISAKDELEDEDADEAEELPPKLPAVVLPPPPEPELPVDDEPPAAPLPPDPAVTESLGIRLDSDTTVPVAGAWSWVLARALSAFWRLTWALYTAACAEAMLAGEGVVVVVVVGDAVLDVGRLEDDAAAVVRVGADVVRVGAGVVRVGVVVVRVGVVVVRFGVVVEGAVVVVLVVVVGAPGGR
jgi:hypothetical protein